MKLETLKETLKRILPDILLDGIRYVRNYRSTGSRGSLKISSANDPVLIDVFQRELSAVSQGLNAYTDEVENARDTNVLLRRNIHRLEKGLIMRPLRNVFAEDYIGETVEAFLRTAERSGDYRDNDELEWAHDVLSKYFQTVSATSKIKPALLKFQKFDSLSERADTDARRVPYARGREKEPVGYTEFLELVRRRASVRWYRQEKVPRELVDKAISAASYSPTACNRQPYYFRIFDDPEMVRKVATIPMGTTGLAHNFPAIAVLVGRLRSFFDARDRHLIYIDGSLAAMTFAYSLETLGLASCMINWPDMEPQESRMNELLNLAPDERVVMLIAFGYPDPEGLIPYSQKKPLDQVRSYNKL